MRALRLPFNEAEQMFKRMVFNVMARNCDDHTKNFAFIMDKLGSWKLAPAFDVCHSYRPESEWVSQHSLSINGKRNNITRHDLMDIAKQMNIKKAEHIRDHIAFVVSNWLVYADKVSVSNDLKNAIEKTLLKL